METSTLTKSPNRLVAVIVGAVFLIIGLVGFFVTDDVGFASHEGHELLGFEINPLHNIVHVILGLALLGAGLKSIYLAKTTNLTVGIIYLVVGIIGLFLVGSDNNILALNGADNVLHFLTAAILIVVSLTQDKGYRDSRTAYSDSVDPSGMDNNPPARL